MFDDLRGPRGGLVRIRRGSATGEALFGRLRLGRVWAGRQTGKQRLGFAWYTKRQWVQFRELADGLEALDDNYEDWLRTAEEAVADLTSRGVVVEKFPLNVDVVAEWCARQGRPFNSAGRAAFKTQPLRKRTTQAGAHLRTKG